MVLSEIQPAEPTKAINHQELQHTGEAENTQQSDSSNGNTEKESELSPEKIDQLMQEFQLYEEKFIAEELGLPPAETAQATSTLNDTELPALSDSDRSMVKHYFLSGGASFSGTLKEQKKGKTQLKKVSLEFATRDTLLITEKRTLAKRSTQIKFSPMLVVSCLFFANLTMNR